MGQLLGIAVVVRIAVIPGGGIAAFDGGHHLVLAVQDGKAAFQIEGRRKAAVLQGHGDLNGGGGLAVPGDLQGLAHDPVAQMIPHEFEQVAGHGFPVFILEPVGVI